MEFNQVIIKKEYYFFELFVGGGIKDNDLILSIKKQKLYKITKFNKYY